MTLTAPHCPEGRVPVHAIPPRAPTPATGMLPQTAHPSSQGVSWSRALGARWDCTSLPQLTLGPAPLGYLMSPVLLSPLSQGRSQYNSLQVPNTTQFPWDTAGPLALPGPAGSALGSPGLWWGSPGVSGCRRERKTQGMRRCCSHQPHGLESADRLRGRQWVWGDQGTP